VWRRWRKGKECKSCARYRAPGKRPGEPPPPQRRYHHWCTASTGDDDDGGGGGGGGGKGRIEIDSRMDIIPAEKKKKGKTLNRFIQRPAG